MSLIGEAGAPGRLLNYVMVGRHNTILADYSLDSGNFVEFAGKIIGYFKRGRYILTFKENEIIYLKEKEDDGVFFLLIASEEIKKLEAFAVLETVRKEFIDSFEFSEIENAKQLSLNKEFRGKLESVFVTTSLTTRTSSRSLISTPSTRTRIINRSVWPTSSRKIWRTS